MIINRLTKLVASLLLLLVISCDSGGGSDPEAAAENVEAGFSALEDALDSCNDVSKGI